MTPTPEQVANRRRLVEALRSGKYRQCFYKAVTPYGAVCAATLCRDVFPDRWVAIGDVTGFSMQTLVKWNDHWRLTFPQIADRIERHLDQPDEAMAEER